MHDTHMRKKVHLLSILRFYVSAHNTFGPAGNEITSVYSDEQHISS